MRIKMLDSPVTQQLRKKRRISMLLWIKGKVRAKRVFLGKHCRHSRLKSSTKMMRFYHMSYRIRIGETMRIWIMKETTKRMRMTVISVDRKEVIWTRVWEVMMMMIKRRMRCSLVMSYIIIIITMRITSMIVGLSLIPKMMRIRMMKVW